MASDDERVRRCRERAQQLRDRAAGLADDLARAGLIASAVHWDGIADQIEAWARRQDGALVEGP